MKLLGITCRVDQEPTYAERRDCLDQNWFVFLEQAGFLPLVLPNHIDLLKPLLRKLQPDGIILSGGNSLEMYQGDAPERDRVDQYLIHWAQKNSRPLLGVCRGMQSIQYACGQSLEPIERQVQVEQEIIIDGKRAKVNSYHQWGTYETVSADLEVWAQGLDGVVKAVKLHGKPLWGIMWHPERLNPFRLDDIKFFREIFS